MGLEPTTYGLQNRCSANWAMPATSFVITIISQKNFMSSDFVWPIIIFIEKLLRRIAMIRAIAPIFLLLISNIFMTFAWYGHLKFKSSALWAVILISWGIAFFEYCFQVPANRIGYSTYNAAQLKTIQEVITLVVFSFFSVFYLKEQFKWNYLVGFALIVLAVFFIFKKWWLWVNSEMWKVKSSLQD